VGGDIYDVCRIDPSHVGFWVADATGHGVSAGLIAAFVKGAFRRSIAASPLEPAAVLSEVNCELLGANFSECQFVTAVYGVYDEDNRGLKLSRAGAPRPTLVGLDGTAAVVSGAGPMLGVAPAELIEFDVIEHEFLLGEALVIHTDGVESLPEFGYWNSSLPSPFDAARFLSKIDARLSEAVEGRERDDVTILTLQAA
jgi:serine phosphatase RsbU (regulator of sigma subunit)